MEEKEEDRVVNGTAVEGYWWWAAASSAQLGWGILAIKRGYAGDSTLMPFKAFAVASIFVGAAASAAAASLLYAGVHSVEDMKTLGANIRTGLGVRPRPRHD
ncbi:potassium voltage-gated channel subfamily Gmember 4 [Striga asiatica]|uniref:Potassium voltage-gated channel subfamily Gmember 4 n=1 Tax=Striga asiatica TaxID=4170 RepID=A0A5A7QMA7_STRAF|nr:potassium voltage-gated channel subfamily Gmember 4 [Striga asiatica]